MNSDIIKTDPLKIAIFGAGSIGCYLGGQLVNAGCEVIFLGRDKFQTAILENGLTLTHFERSEISLETKSFEFSTQAPSISIADIILVTVKSQDTEAAAISIAKFGRSDALIISFQNGVSNADVLKKHLADHTVLGGVVPFNVTGTGPGKFHCGTEGSLSVQNTDILLDKLVLAFAHSGQGLDIYDDILAV